MSAAGATARSERLNEGEFAFRREDFDDIAGILYDSAGIYLPETKSALVYSRLVKRLRALNMSSFMDYCALIKAPEGEKERAQMRDCLTTNVTRFFREQHHFDHLRRTVLPPLIKRAKSGGRVRIWSAGCSSGQEPYSIALTILSEMPEARGSDIRILATDISSSILATARTARYLAEDTADIPGDLKNRWMEKDGEHFVFDDAVRAMVAIKQLNLMENWPMKGPFDAIFCRNVVIYFDEQTQSRVWRRMVPLLADGGALYIGHSERVSGPALDMLRPSGITTYMRNGRAAA